LTGGLLLAVWLIDVALLLYEVRWWQGQLAVRRWIEPNPVSADGTITLHHQVLAPQTPLADLRDEVPETLELVRESDALTQTFRARRRGLYDFGPVRVRRLGPFGLTRVELIVESPTRLVVWPAVAGLGPALSRGVGQDDAGRSGPPVQNPEDATVRDYHTGDDWRRIHWRSSARRSRLMIRAEEPDQIPVAVVQPALGPGASDDDNELALSLAASTILALEGAGYRVRLVTRDGSTVGSGSEHLDRLAEFDTTAAGDDLVTVFDPGPMGPAAAPNGGEPRLEVGAAGRMSAALTVVVAVSGAGLADTVSGLPTALPVRTAPALAVLVGPGLDEWAHRLDQAGWAAAPIPSLTALDVAAELTGTTLATLSKGRS
jgi:hypothetical protein